MIKLLDERKEKLWKMFHGEFVSYKIDSCPANSNLCYLGAAVYDSKIRPMNSVVILEQGWLQYSDGDVDCYHEEESDDYE